LKKVKKNWSYESKRASIHLRTRKAPSKEANSQPLARQTLTYPLGYHINVSLVTK